MTEQHLGSSFISSRAGHISSNDPIEQVLRKADASQILHVSMSDYTLLVLIDGEHDNFQVLTPSLILDSLYHQVF